MTKTAETYASAVAAVEEASWRALVEADRLGRRTRKLLAGSLHLLEILEQTGTGTEEQRKKIRKRIVWCEETLAELRRDFAGLAQSDPALQTEALRRIMARGGTDGGT